MCECMRKTCFIDTADLLGDDEMEVTPSVKVRPLFSLIVFFASHCICVLICQWNIIQTFLNMPDVRPVVLNRFQV